MERGEHPNSLANLKKFTTTYRPKNPGRKPSHLKKWIKEHNVSAQDVRLLLTGILTKAKSIEDLTDILRDPKTPPIILFPLRALISDYSKNKTDTYKFLLEYGFGPPLQEIRHSGGMENTNINMEISYEERQEIIDVYIARRLENNPDLLPGSGNDADEPAQDIPRETQETKPEKS